MTTAGRESLLDARESERAKVVAADLLVTKKREGACPLCGAITPACVHVVWAKAVTG